ncbi:MAG: tRNA (adenosine(37)-N6)-threonylcarbamoyltransferase complex ATPase subunit type 1 TsaE [Clostridia bacterium]|nr:tRNA (adenosine(37)-N6)-threonylcarbamoyltransferase complex ATPase subunit type 1 TsaE [Clostridia bacterium]
MTYNVSSTEGTEQVARGLAERLATLGRESAYIALMGEMGVGKTAFVRGFASYFGISTVKSPTYTVVNEYLGEASIFHFDLYRISNEDDLYSIGYDDYLARRGYILVEWSERIAGEIPEGAIYVKISRTARDENERIIEITE